jgi:hypothetical protein
MSRYVIAVKRHCRGSVGSDWPKHLNSVQGVRIISQAGNLTQVDATPKAIVRVKQLLGDKFHVEESIVHHAQEPVSA